MLASSKLPVPCRARARRRAPGAPYRLSDLDLASRLSFFLWSSIPDDELLEVASRGQLKNPAVLERQVRRMLADPRSQALVDNFAGQWLQLRNLRASSPDQNEFPDFDDNLRQAFQRETELLFDSIIREDRNVLDLLTADYTFVNERLARHYGIPNVYGSQFRRVTGDRRHAEGAARARARSCWSRRIPIARRRSCAASGFWTTCWARRRRRRRRTSRRSRTAASGRSHERCASRWRRTAPIRCARAATRLMDPLGFALENFDAVGAWRTRDAGAPIDASGQLHRRHARWTAS